MLPNVSTALGEQAQVRLWTVVGRMKRLVEMG